MARRGRPRKSTHMSSTTKNDQDELIYAQQENENQIENIQRKNISNQKQKRSRNNEEEEFDEQPKRKRTRKNGKSGLQYLINILRQSNRPLEWSEVFQLAQNEPDLQNKNRDQLRAFLWGNVKTLMSKSDEPQVLFVGNTVELSEWNIAHDAHEVNIRKQALGGGKRVKLVDLFLNNSDLQDQVPVGVEVETGDEGLMMTQVEEGTLQYDRGNQDAYISYDSNTFKSPTGFVRACYSKHNKDYIGRQPWRKIRIVDDRNPDQRVLMGVTLHDLRQSGKEKENNNDNHHQIIDLNSSMNSESENLNFSSNTENITIDSKLKNVVETGDLDEILEVWGLSELKDFLRNEGLDLETLKMLTAQDVEQSIVPQLSQMGKKIKAVRLCQLLKKQL
eukprot:gb/GECH01013317.1/.p1 GENE.gb/GECH01013317.1/~~gb/GECH01013317.1/.p1  ORF type:complete len:390 (+),score=134.91 gb/GECH01013317.1/:1-1170(+)